jgi:hypothetical protein
MFESVSRGQPGLDLAQLIQTYGPAGGFTLPPGAPVQQPGMINSSGMVKNADGTSSFPDTPRLGLFAAGRQPASPAAPMMADREPLNLGAPPPDQLSGTRPIGTPGIGDGLPGAIPMDPRVRKATAPHFFENGGLGQKLAMAIGPALMAAGGNQAGANQVIANFQRQKEWAAEQVRQRQQDQFAREKFGWEMRKDMRPEIRSVGRSVVSVPFEGDPSVVYQAPTDAEQYAATLGLNEGDEGYADAVMDYTLRSNGPTAYEQRRALEDQRFGNRVNLRGVPTYANLHPRTGGAGRGNGGAPRPPNSVSAAIAPIVAKLASGATLTSAEQSALALYNRGGRGGVKPTLPINPMTPAPRPSAPRLPIKQAGPVRVSSPAEARKLKPGTQFITPDGKLKVR